MLQYGFRRDMPPSGTGRTGLASTEPDQRWIGYLPIDERPAIRWPGGARVALWICPNVLQFEYLPPHDDWLMSYTRMEPPDVMMFGRQEYGGRAGFWRILDILDRSGARCTAVVNTAALVRYPDIGEAIAERGWDLLGHGRINTRFIYDASEAQERAYYAEMRDVAREITGIEMTGMGGPGPQSATARTVDILADLGFLYHGDWFLDDQPFPLSPRAGRLLAMPYAVEINDAAVLATAYEGEEYVDMVKRQFDRLHAEGAESGRVMSVSFHPHLFGQPQRARYLEEALDYLMSADGVWHATGREIAEHYYAEVYDDVVARLRASAADP